MASAAIATAMHADALLAGQIPARAVAASVAVAGSSAKQPITARAVVCARRVCAVPIGAALEVARLLHTLTVGAVPFDHHTALAAAACVGAVCIEQKESIDDRTTAASGNHHSSEAHVEHVFHSEIPSIRKRRPAAMGRRTGSSETTGGIGRAGGAG